MFTTQSKIIAVLPWAFLIKHLPRDAESDNRMGQCIFFLVSEVSIFLSAFNPCALC